MQTFEHIEGCHYTGFTATWTEETGTVFVCPLCGAEAAYEPEQPIPTIQEMMVIHPEEWITCPEHGPQYVGGAYGALHGHVCHFCEYE